MGYRADPNQRRVYLEAAFKGAPVFFWVPSQAFLYDPDNLVDLFTEVQEEVISLGWVPLGELEDIRPTQK